MANDVKPFETHITLDFAISAPRRLTHAELGQICDEFQKIKPQVKLIDGKYRLSEIILTDVNEGRGVKITISDAPTKPKDGP